MRTRWKSCHRKFNVFNAKLRKGILAGSTLEKYNLQKKILKLTFRKNYDIPLPTNAR